MRKETPFNIVQTISVSNEYGLKNPNQVEILTIWLNIQFLIKVGYMAKLFEIDPFESYMYCMSH